MLVRASWLRTNCQPQTRSIRVLKKVICSACTARFSFLLECRVFLWNAPVVAVVLVRWEANVKPIFFWSYREITYFISFSSYLELLGTFRKLVGMKKSEFLSARNRTKVGLDKVSRLTFWHNHSESTCFARQRTKWLIYPTIINSKIL